MIVVPLGTGQHRVVIGHHRTARVIGPELRGVNRAEAGDHAVGRCVLHEIFDATPTPLRRDRKRAVFDEAIGVAQISHILARCARVELATLGECFRSRGIEGQSVGGTHFFEIAARRVEIDVGYHVGAVLSMDIDGEQGQRLTLVEYVAHADENCGDGATRRSRHHVMHFHRLQHRQRLATFDLYSDTDIDTDHAGTHRRRHDGRAGRHGDHGAGRHCGDARRTLRHNESRRSTHQSRAMLLDIGGIEIAARQRRLG